MKLTLYALVATIGASSAQTVEEQLVIDGNHQYPVNLSRAAEMATAPVVMNGAEMSCSFDGMVGVARVCPVKANANLTIDYRDWMVEPTEGAIDVVLKGPYAVYLQLARNGASGPAINDDWIKIWDDGYEELINEWCPEKVVAEDGQFAIALPETLQEGNYFIRAELLALSGAVNSHTDPHFHVSCTQVFVSSDGIFFPNPEDTVAVSSHSITPSPPVEANMSTDALTLPPPVPSADLLDKRNASPPYPTGYMNSTHHHIISPNDTCASNSLCGPACHSHNGTCPIHNPTPPLNMTTIPQPTNLSTSPSPTPITHRTCGSASDTTCLNSHHGPCCGEDGTCGSGIGFCGYGCQVEYGICDVGIDGRDAEGVADDTSAHARSVRRRRGNGGV